MIFSDKIRALGYSMGQLRNELDEARLDFLRDHYESMNDAKIKRLIKYFSAGKEIPYPLYKDREKVMNP